MKFSRAGICMVCLLVLLIIGSTPTRAEYLAFLTYFKHWKKCYDAGDFKGAVDVATAELAKHPQSFNAYSLRHMAHMRLREYSKALDDANLGMNCKAEKLAQPEMYWYQAEALVGLKRYDEALSALMIYQSRMGSYVSYKTEFPGLVQLCQTKLAAKDDPESKPLDVESLAKQIANLMKDKQKADEAAIAAKSPDTQDKEEQKPVNRPVRDKWALVIGVSKFSDNSIPSLKFAAKDAQDFYQFLTTKGNFAKDHVRLLTNEEATQRRILDELGDKFLPRVVKPDDLVVIYFSSHGSPSRTDIRGKNFLVAYDSEKRNLYASGIEMQQLTDVIKDRVQSDRVLLVLDACHSGATSAGEKSTEPASNFNIQSIPLGSGQTVICSSQAEERSWESRRYENGIFTKQLMQALLKNGDQTAIDDAYKSLMTSVQNEVQEDEAAKQTPVFKSTWKGNNLMLCLPPAAPEPLPAAVRSNLAPDSVGKK